MMINDPGYLGEKKMGHCWLHPGQYNVDHCGTLGRKFHFKTTLRLNNKDNVISCQAHL